MPLWLYLRGLVLFAFSASSRPTYILGHGYSHGVWFYFPALFILKSPLAFLLLLLLAIVIAIFLKRRSRGQQSAIPSGMELNWRAVWLSLVVFVAVSMLNRLDISIRHFTIAANKGRGLGWKIVNRLEVVSGGGRGGMRRR